MNNKFLITFFSFIFACTISVTAMANDKSDFTLTNKSGYNIKYRHANQNAPAGSVEEYLLPDGASVILKKEKPYSIRRSGVGSTITAGWWNVPSKSEDLFRSITSMYAFFSATVAWDKSPDASITIYPGNLYGWIFEGNKP